MCESGPVRIFVRSLGRRAASMLVLLALVLAASVGMALAAAGDLDTSFGMNGKLTFGFGGLDYAYAVALQPDGKIVVAGFTETSVGIDVAVVRLNANGSPDTSFHKDGKLTFGFGGVDLALAVAMQPDGKIVLAGTGNPNRDVAVVRLSANGSFDSSFDQDGIVGVDFGSQDGGQAVALQPNGKIVVAGYTFVGNDVAVVRLNPNGSPDAGFGTNGKLTFDFGGGRQR